MAFALPAIASAVAAAAPAAAAAATKVSLMAIAKSVLMNVAINAAMSALQPQVGSAGRTYEWTLDPNAPIPFAAGRVGVAGTVVHLDTYGPDKMYYGFVSILSGAGPVKAITGFKGDDEVVTFDAGGKAISSQWAGEMWLRNRLGTQPDTALTNPTGLKNNAQLPSWTAAHKLSGKACYMLVLGENSKRSAYPTGEPKPLVTVEGLFGWDPRKDSTYPGGVGTCRLNDPSTWVWLDNPILWGLKWALGLWEGPIGKGAPGVDYQVGGIGATVDGIKVERFVAAANVADANGWKVAAYPTTDDDKSQVLDSFLQAGGAIYAQEQGKISCIQRAAPRASAITITAADTAGPLEIDTAATRIDRINTIRPRFWSEAHRWQMTAIDDVTAEAYRVEDGAVRPRGIDFAYVPLATQAAQLAALQIANTREGIAGTIPLKPHLRNIAPGTAFTITEPGFLLDGLKCLCLNSDYDPLTGVVSVTFVSETDAKYPFALGQSPIPPAPPVLTPPVTTVTPPQAGEWVLTSELLTDNGATVPALVLTGEVDNARAQSVIFEFQPVDPDNSTAPWADLWTGAGTEDPTVERKEITGLTPTPYWAAVSYRVAGNISARLVLGPVTAGSVVTPPVPAPATVAPAPVLTIFTAIQPDGTEVSNLTATWAGVAGATTYDIDIDDGTAVWTESRGVAAIKNLRVAPGRTYRLRVKASNRDGVRSLAWSGWSNSVSAGGDTTAPAVVSAPTVTPLARRLVLTWQNPADADYSHIRLYRNVTGSAHVEADLYAVRVEGTTFTDTNVQAGVSYGYACKSVDRSGNESAFRYMGAAVPAYISTGGGDVAPTDPILVTGYGTSALVFGQTAWATSPLPTTRLNYLDNAGNLDSLSRVNSRGLSLLTGRTADFIDYTAGGTVNSLRPGEAGANVTEGRTAALVSGQTAWATSPIPTTHLTRPGSNLLFNGSFRLGQQGWVGPMVHAFDGNSGNYGSFVVGGRASDYMPATAGVSYIMSAEALFHQSLNHSIYLVFLNEANAYLGEGSYCGGGQSWARDAGSPIVAPAGTAKMYVQASTPNITPGGYVAVRKVKIESGGTATPFNDDRTDGARYTNGASIDSLRPGEAGANVTESRTAALLFGQGQLATQNRATALQVPYSNIANSFADEDFNTTLINPVNGAAFDTTAETTVTLGAINSIKSPDGAGKAAGAQTQFTTFSDAAMQVGVVPGSSFRFNGKSLIKAGFTGLLRAFLYFTGPTGATVGGPTIVTMVDRRSTAQVGTVVYDFDQQVSVPAGAVKAYFVFIIDWSSTQANAGYALVAKPGMRFVADFGSIHPSAIRLGSNIRRADGSTMVTDATAITSLGTAALLFGQAAWATYTGLTPANVAGQVQYLNTAGRIVDGRGLPLNAASGSGIVLNPALPLGPGSTPENSIAVAALTATLAGNVVLSLPSATITGLSATTPYAVFRDLQTSTYVAIGSGATPYFTSADRYFYLGTQTTSQAGGGYLPPNPRPPGGGGGVGGAGDTPAYVEPY